MIRIKIPDFPFPPQSNHLYASMIRKGKIIRFPSQSHKEYSKACDDYHFFHAQDFKQIYRHLHKFESIKVTVWVLFAKSKVYTKKGVLKKMDVSNRSKALLDQLSKAIGIDDCHFNEIVFKKCVSDDEENSRCLIVLEPCSILKEVDAKKEFG